MMMQLLKNKLFLYGVAAVIVVVLGFVFFGNGNGKEVTKVSRMDIVQEVMAIGKVKPSQNVSLGFDKSGRISSVFADVGLEVSKGQVLASLESGDINADILKANATLEEEIIKLRELQNTAPASYADAYRNLENSLKEGFISADNAVRNRADQFFKNTTSSPRFEVSIEFILSFLVILFTILMYLLMFLFL